MNIFYLDNNPTKCAEMHPDKHCIKMILEYAQILSTTHRFLDGISVTGKSDTGRMQTRYTLSDGREELLYTATHINHPSTAWARESDSNYIWLTELLDACCKEYSYRYGRVHKVEAIGLMQLLKEVIPDNIKSGKFTEPTPAMPDECKVLGDSIASYKKYYLTNKQHLLCWDGKVNSRIPPDWYLTFNFNHV